jgi:hypothetical protein
MPRIPHVAIVKALAVLATSIALTACSENRGSKSPDNAAPERPSLKAGQSLFAFDYQAVTDVLVVKSDPVAGDRWSARLHRPDPKGADWEVSAEGPEMTAPLDRKADGYFILHLLDTLRTLQVTEPSAQGPDASLGLAPPRFAIQWKTPTEQFELRTGLPARTPGSVFAWVPGRPAFTANGATLQMLDYIKSFESLRLKTWAGVAADDVDEIELTQAGKPVFYAQREGAGWADRKRKPVRADVGAWLERLTRSRVLKFVDDPEAARKLSAQAKAKPLAEGVLKDRQGKATRLWIAAASGKLVALSSARPEGVFEI